LSTSEPKASRAKVHLAAPDRLIWIVVGAIVLWGVWALGSELMLNLRLSHEVSSLRQSNAQLAAANGQAQKELGTAGSPAAMEEAARKSGYARSGEQVYVIVKPSGSAAGGAPSTAAGGVTASARPASTGSGPAGSASTARKQDGGVVGAIENIWRNLWH
jgi:cell division protein FtsB